MQPFADTFAGGVRVAAGDIDHDGYPDLIAAAGPGGGPHVRVFSGRTGSQLGHPLGTFYAYEQGFSGGVYVASADVDGDGWADVITAAGEGGGPHVKVFSGATGDLINSFYGFDSAFRGGATIAAADTTGDGRAELIIGAGPGAGPHVKVFDLTTSPEPTVVYSFYAFDESFTGGADVGSDELAGDVDGDQVPDIVVGAGAGGGPHVKVFSGATGAEVRSFLAFDPAMTAGVRVGTAFVDDDPFADIIAGTGAGVGGEVKVFSGLDGTELATPMSPYTPFGAAYTGGLYVGGSNDPDAVSISIGSASPGSVAQGGTVTLTATVSDGNLYNGQQTPTGTVTFTTSGGSVTLATGVLTPAGTGKATATAVVDPVLLSPSYGMYWLAANYSGDSWFLSGTGNGYGFYVSPPTAPLPPPPPANPQPSIDVSFDHTLPVNANNDNGSAWKQGKKFIPTTRDFNAEDLNVNDPQLKPVTITVGGGFVGNVTLNATYGGAGRVAFWQDQQKDDPFTFKQIAGGPNPTTFTVYMEGTHESSIAGDVDIEAVFSITAWAGGLPAPPLAVADSDITTVTPFLLGSSIDDGNGVQIVQAGGMFLGLQGEIEFKTDFFTSPEETIKFLRVNTEDNAGHNQNTGVTASVLTATNGFRLFEQTTMPNISMPLLDYDGNAAAAALDPTNTPQAQQIFANGQPVPGTFEYTMSDAPVMWFLNGFTAISADLTRDRFDYVDHQMVFREYVVVRYADGTLYPVLTVEWSVNFYVHTNVANFGPNTLSPLSLMGWDAAGFERDNSDPLVTEPPIANDSFGFREIT